MSSERKIEANRRNAELSTGPRTEEGKRISRANALTHGFCAAVVNIPDESSEFTVEREDAWQAELNPHNKSVQSFLVKTACKHANRLDRFQAIYDAKIRSRARSAKRRYKNSRAKKIEDLGRQLAEKCDIVVRRMRNTSEGCQWMIDRFNETTPPDIEAEAYWEDSDARKLAQLMGSHASQEPNGTAVPFVNEAGEIKAYHYIRDRLWSTIDPAIKNEDEYMWPQERARDEASLPERRERAAEATKRMRDYIADQIKQLSQLKEKLEAEEALEEESRMYEMRFDDSDRGKLMHRYEMDSERGFSKCIKELKTLNRDEKPIPHMAGMKALMGRRPEPESVEKPAPIARNEPTARASESPMGPLLDSPNANDLIAELYERFPKSRRNKK